MKNRLLEFDMLKGLGILGIVLGHLGIESLSKIVFVFHVPLFYLISGYFLNTVGSFNNFLVKKLKQLIKPYIYIWLAIIALSVPFGMLYNRDVPNELFTWFFGGLYGSGTLPGILALPSFIGAIWFLLALFWGLIIARAIIDRFDYLNSFLILVIIFIIGVKSVSYGWLPFSVQAGLTSALFVFLGYLAKQYGVLEKKYGTLPYLFSLGVFIYCVKHNNGFSLASNNIGNGIVDIVGAILTSFLLYSLCSYLVKIKGLSVVNRILSWFGEHSLIILGFHLISLNLFHWLTYKPFLYMLSNQNDFICNILLIFVNLLYVTIFTAIFLRIKQSFVAGA